MIYTNTRSSFPDQVVPEEEKMSLEYGLQVARAIEGEWFNSSLGGFRYENNYNIFYRRRLYARGEQPVQKYKDELSINGDLSYLNLDWKPVPIIPKFVDIVVNGMSDRLFTIKTYAQDAMSFEKRGHVQQRIETNVIAQDPASQKTRTDYAQHLHKQIAAKALMDQVQESLGIDLSQSPPGMDVPQTEQELELQTQEAEEEALPTSPIETEPELDPFGDEFLFGGMGFGMDGENLVAEEEVILPPEPEEPLAEDGPAFFSIARLAPLSLAICPRARESLGKQEPPKLGPG